MVAVPPCVMMAPRQRRGSSAPPGATLPMPSSGIRFGGSGWSRSGLRTGTDPARGGARAGGAADPDRRAAGRRPAAHRPDRRAQKGAGHGIADAGCVAGALRGKIRDDLGAEADIQANPPRASPPCAATSTCVGKTVHWSVFRGATVGAGRGRGTAPPALDAGRIRPGPAARHRADQAAVHRQALRRLPAIAASGRGGERDAALARPDALPEAVAKGAAACALRVRRGRSARSGVRWRDRGPRRWRTPPAAAPGPWPAPCPAPPPTGRRS